MASLVLAFFVKSGALTVWEPTDGKKGGKAVKRKWRRHDVQVPKQLLQYMQVFVCGPGEWFWPLLRGSSLPISSTVKNILIRAAASLLHCP